MTNITYKKGDCLAYGIKHPRVVIHSCNCNGTWGGGIARQMAIKYYRAESDYIDICDTFGSKLLGKFILIPSYRTPNLLIGCLFTASFGGEQHGTGQSILHYTKLALQDMINKLSGEELIQDEIDSYSSKYMKNIQVYMKIPISEYELEMPKINSGIFGVPWPETEKLLEEFSSSKFTVYEI